MSKLNFEHLIKLTQIQNWAQHQNTSLEQTVQSNLAFLRYLANGSLLWNYLPGTKAIKFCIEDGMVRHADGEFMALKALRNSFKKDSDARKFNLELFHAATNYLAEQNIEPSLAFTDFDGIRFPLYQFDGVVRYTNVAPLTVVREGRSLVIYFLLPWTKEKLNGYQLDLMTTIIEATFGRATDLDKADYRLLFFPKIDSDKKEKPLRAPKVLTRNEFVLLDKQHLDYQLGISLQALHETRKIIINEDI